MSKEFEDRVKDLPELVDEITDIIKNELKKKDGILNSILGIKNNDESLEEEDVKKLDSFYNKLNDIYGTMERELNDLHNKHTIVKSNIANDPIDVIMEMDTIMMDLGNLSNNVNITIIEYFDFINDRLKMIVNKNGDVA